MGEKIMIPVQEVSRFFCSTMCHQSAIVLMAISICTKVSRYYLAGEGNSEIECISIDYIQKSPVP